MERLLASLCLLGTLLQASAGCAASASEFRREGDYLIGGLFDIHHVSGPLYHHRPEVVDCSSKPFLLPNYRRFQLMRFAIEEINNSTDLLPNVSLGYELFDHCSDTLNFPDVFKLISVGGVIEPWAEAPRTRKSDRTTAIAVVGPFTSTQALTVAPWFMMNLIPLVSYGTTSTVFSENSQYPSFLRTIPPNRATIEVIVSILQHFGWRWVAFLNSEDDFGVDGLKLFIQRIETTDICLAYTKGVSGRTNFSQVFRQIQAQKVNVIIGFAPKLTAEALIASAIRLNVTDKVWIADDGWSLNKMLPKLEGIRSLGTVLGVSQPVETISGFDQFIRWTKSRPSRQEAAQGEMCHQVCNCTGLTAEDIIAADPSFSFPVYSAVYAVAHALHHTLRCGAAACNNNGSVHPYMVLAEMQKLNFTLLNTTINFAPNGDPNFGFFSVVFWNKSGDAQEIGRYMFHPSRRFFINSTEIQWHTNGEVPTSVCSPECSAGFAKKQTGLHQCCFNCEICPKGTYINTTKDAYTCVSCSETEWSAEGSTSCNLRAVEVVPLTDTAAVLIMAAAWALVGLSVAVCVLFAVNYNTPVVRSAGGPMCFLILVCLSLCSVSVFFYFGQPTPASCILRFLPFLLFYTVCLACFVVRSFQIVCIFKIAAKFPKLHSWWMKYHGQWLLITVAFAIQAFLLLMGYSFDPPRPYNETQRYPEQIVPSCSISVKGGTAPVILLLLLCCLCFIFSYMGKDLPKNYNEAKTITFCLLVLILTWVLFTSLFVLYRGKHIQSLQAVAVLSSLYSFLLWYFFPKCSIILFQPQKNTQQYFQGLIQTYTKTISQ